MKVSCCRLQTFENCWSPCCMDSDRCWRCAAAEVQFYWYTKLSNWVLLCVHGWLVAMHSQSLLRCSVCGQEGAAGACCEHSGGHMSRYHPVWQARHACGAAPARNYRIRADSLSCAASQLRRFDCTSCLGRPPHPAQMGWLHPGRSCSLVRLALHGIIDASRLHSVAPPPPDLLCAAMPASG